MTAWTLTFCNLSRALTTKISNEVLVCHKDAGSWYILLSEAILAKNRIVVTVKTLICWQTDPPLCNKYTQSVLLYLQMFLLLPWTGNAVSRYPPVGVLSFCAMTHAAARFSLAAIVSLFRSMLFR